MEDSIDLLEKQWRRIIERDVNLALVKGFQHQVEKRDELVMKDSWFDFIDEMKNLLHDLMDFFSRNYVSVKSLSSGSRRTSSEPNIEQNLLEENDGGSHHVWKIIKSHESMIRSQQEQMTLMETGEDSLSSYWIKRNECINAMERRIQDAIAMLENLTMRNHKVSDMGVGFGRNRAQEKRRIPKSHRRNDATSTMIQSFEAEMKKLQEERDGLCFQISMIEDTYQLLFRGVVRDFCCDGLEEKERPRVDDGSEADQILQHFLESNIREDIHVLVFRETLQQWKTKTTLELDSTLELLLLLEEEEEEEEEEQTDFFAVINSFQFLVDNFEVVLQENLESKFLRLEALKRQVDALTQPVAWIRTKKLLFEKAFISRSRNLNLAESEVDLLGDQVETLLSLLKTIYMELNRNATVFSSYFQVSGILKLIEKELDGVDLLDPQHITKMQ